MELFTSGTFTLFYYDFLLFVQNLRGLDGPYVPGLDVSGTTSVIFTFGATDVLRARPVIVSFDTNTRSRVVS